MGRASRDKGARGERLTVDGRACECIGKFTVALVQFEDGTKRTLIKGADGEIMAEGILRAAKEFADGVDFAEVLRR